MAVILFCIDKQTRQIDKLQTTRKISMEIFSNIFVSLLNTVKNLTVDIWSIYFLCGSFYIAVFSYMMQVVKFLEEHTGLSNGMATVVSTLLYVVSILLNPIIGYVVEKCGNQQIFMLMAFVFSASAHLKSVFIIIWLPPAKF